MVGHVKITRDGEAQNGAVEHINNGNEYAWVAVYIGWGAKELGRNIKDATCGVAGCGFVKGLCKRGDVCLGDAGVPDVVFYKDITVVTDKPTCDGGLVMTAYNLEAECWNGERITDFKGRDDLGFCGGVGNDVWARYEVRATYRYGFCVGVWAQSYRSK